MKKLQKGRSMIEMLGVLAIVGVLSIGGLAGYTMAMNRYRASNISDYVSRCVVVAQTKSVTGRLAAEASCVDILNESIPGWLAAGTTVKVKEVGSDGEFEVNVTSLPDAVDKVLIDRFDGAGDSGIGGVKYATNGKFTFLGGATPDAGD